MVRINLNFLSLIYVIVLLDRGELGLATTYFETAVRYGSPFEAYYYLGEIAAAQASAPSMPSHIASSSCAMAVSFHKLVSERGVWDDDLLRDAEIAWMTASDHGKEIAMLKWWIAAERGSEIAQNNLAYVLDQGKLLFLIWKEAFSAYSQTGASCVLLVSRQSLHQTIRRS
jgi:hypothetical protein